MRRCRGLIPGRGPTAKGKEVLRTDILELLVNIFEAIPRATRQEIVRFVIDELGLSKSEVARMMGVTPSAVTRFVKGEAAPSPESLAKLFLSLEPEERGQIVNMIVEYVTSLLKSIRILLERGFAAADGKMFEVSIEELIDTAMLLLEPTGGYRGAQSSPHRLGERFSSEPPVGSETSSRLRSRL